jgi:hypothetical protein
MNYFSDTTSARHKTGSVTIGPRPVASPSTVRRHGARQSQAAAVGSTRRGPRRLAARHPIATFLVGGLSIAYDRTNNDNGIVATLTSGDARLLALAIGPILLTVAVAIPIRHRLTRDHRLMLDGTGVNGSSFHAQTG